MRLKIFFAFLILGNLSALAHLRKEKFLSSRTKIETETVRLIGANIQYNQKKVLGLQGKFLYEVEVGREISIQEMTDYNLDLFTLRYFTYQGTECLYQLIYQERVLVDNADSLLCSPIKSNSLSYSGQ